MQLISILTALTGFQLAAALPSAIKGTLGSTLCVGINLDKGTYCETIDNVHDHLTPGYCVKLDDRLWDQVSSIAPVAGSWCTYFTAEGCVDTTPNGCGKFDANSPINDLTTVSPTNANAKCEGNMDKKIRSFLCNYV